MHREDSRLKTDFRYASWLYAAVLIWPAVIAIRFVRHFGVNVPVHDEWNFMPTVAAFYGGGRWLPMVWANYVEHRIPIPKLIILYLSRITALNVKTEMYLSVCLMGLSVYLCWKLIRRTQGCPTWLIVPAGWLMLSTSQYENLLVGWQFQIPLVNVFICGMVLLLGTRTLTRRRLFGAAACATAATFSFASGPFGWPCGLFVISCRRAQQRRSNLATWTALMGITALLYLWGFQGRGGANVYLDPLRSGLKGTLALFLCVLGNNFGEGRIVPGLVSGAVLLVLLAGVSLLAFFQGNKEILAPWRALSLYSMLSALGIAFGRNFQWQSSALASRYMTLVVFIPIATMVIGTAGIAGLRPPWRVLARSAATIVLLAGCFLNYRTSQFSLLVGNGTMIDKKSVLPCLLDYRHASSECLSHLYLASGEFVRQNAAALDTFRLGPFHDARPLPAK